MSPADASNSLRKVLIITIHILKWILGPSAIHQSWRSKGRYTGGFSRGGQSKHTSLEANESESGASHVCWERKCKTSSKTMPYILDCLLVWERIIDSWTLVEIVLPGKRRGGKNPCTIFVLVLIAFIGQGLLTGGLRRDSRHGGRIHTVLQFGSFHP